MPEQLVNNASTTLNGSITNSATSLTVVSASLFPSSGNFRILVDSEYMLVTAVSGTIFTVTRGIEGTTAAAHSSGAVITALLTAGGVDQYLLDRGLIFGIGDRKPSSPGSYDEEFEGTADTLPSGWSWTTAPSGSDSWTLNSRWPSIFALEGTGNGTYYLNRTFAPGSGDFGIWFKAFCGPSRSISVAQFRCYAYNTAGSEAQAWEYFVNAREDLRMRGLKKISSAESEGFGSFGGTAVSPSATMMYGGLTRTSGNVWTMWYSGNGVAWQQYGNTETHSFTIDHLTFQMATCSGINSFIGLDWLRYRADLNFPRP